VAGTAGSSSILPDFYWDYTNSILYVCTTTGTSLTAVWTAINASSAAAVVPPPQGYLTPVAGTPIITSDSIAATILYYTPHVGNLVPIYNGTSFTPISFSELTLTLNSSHVASNIYDVFIFNNSGILTVVTGPSWSAGTGGNISPGTCARGTGAGGATLSRVNGIYTNGVQITGRNGSTTYTIAANLATYLGSIFIDSSNGQVTCHRSTGQSRKWGIWNAYNRAPIQLIEVDPTANWTSNATFTWRQSRADAANVITTFVGLPEELVTAEFCQRAFEEVLGSSQDTVQNGIGVNSTSSPSGMNGYSSTLDTGIAGNIGSGSNMLARHTLTPSVGINNLNALEQVTVTASGNSVNCTMYGTSANYRFSAAWRG
jgi:hypothetical protein